MISALESPLQILVHHVGEDQALLRSKCRQLRGAAGAARMDAALSAARAEEEARHADAVAAAAAAQEQGPTPQVIHSAWWQLAIRAVRFS